MAEILIIDDDELLCYMMTAQIRSMGHNAVYAFTLTDGLLQIQSKSFDVIFLDVMLPDGNGLFTLNKIKELPDAPEVIIITSEGDPNGVEIALKGGAWDYIEKPPSLKNLTLPLNRALQYRREKQRSKAARSPVSIPGIVGGSPQLQAAIELLAQAANSEANVLITGETGTGKELFARAIHENSNRKEHNLVVVDCASLPETLVESVLFGHEKGAYTGATAAGEGLIKQAHQGTLFLDEIGELPLHMQKAFIRVLQERRFRPVGGKNEISSDFRLMAATNRNLEHMVQSGKFREDLLFRLRALAIDLPPLRSRPQDITDLTRYFMNKLGKKYGDEKKTLSQDFFESLNKYDWPGNVRELINALESAMAASGQETTLFSRHLPINIRVQLAQRSLSRKKKIGENRSNKPEGIKALAQLKEIRDEAMEKIESDYLKDLMVVTVGDMDAASEISGLSRSRLYYLLKKHRIQKED